MAPTAFHYRVPKPPLNEWVELLWMAGNPAQPHAQERLLPTGSMDLVFTLDQHGRLHSTLCGARSQFLLLDASVRFMAIGVRFRPGGGIPFFDVPAGELQNQAVPLDCLWGRSAATLADRLWSAASPEAKFTVLEGALLDAAAGRFGGHPAVRHAVATIHATHGACSIADLTTQIGLSARRFIEVFRNEVGLSPKLFCRIRRFNQLLGTFDLRPNVNWTELALACGYFDQAHFIHDFRSFAGLTPSAYVEQRTSRYHVRVSG